MNFKFNNENADKLADAYKDTSQIFSFNLNSNLSFKHLRLKNSDYVPLFALSFPIHTAESKLSYYKLERKFVGWRDYGLREKKSIKTLVNYQQDIEKKNLLLSDYLYSNVDRVVKTSRSEYVTNKFHKELVTDEIQALTNRLNEIRENVISSSLNLSIGDIKSSFGRTSYKRIFDRIVAAESIDWSDRYLKFRIDHLRLCSYLSNFGFCAKINWDSEFRHLRNIKSTEVLFSYMVKVEMIPYIKLCMVLGEEPHPDSLELWVNNKLDVPKGVHKNVRPNYRKKIKLFAESRGIKIEESSNLSADIFKTTKLPTFKTIKERKEWYNFISKEFLHSLEDQQSKNRNSTNETIKLVL